MFVNVRVPLSLFLSHSSTCVSAMTRCADCATPSGVMSEAQAPSSATTRLATLLSTPFSGSGDMFAQRKRKEGEEHKEGHKDLRWNLEKEESYGNLGVRQSK